MRVALVICALMFAAGCGASGGTPVAAPSTTTSAPPPTLNARVLVQVDARFTNPQGSSCTTKFPFTDLQANAFVSFTDAAGTTAGATTLGAGYLDGSGHCSFPATAELTPGSPFYSMVVAGRDPVTKSAVDVASKGFGVGFGMS